MGERFLGLNEVAAVILAALMAGAIAIWAIRSQRASARRHATIAFIQQSEGDREIIEARQRFIALASENGKLAEIADRPFDDDDMSAVRRTLNQFELVSTAIQFDVFDLELYRRWNKTTVLRYAKLAKPFIDRLQERLENRSIYHELSELVRWMEESPPKRRVWPRRLF